MQIPPLTLTVGTVEERRIAKIFIEKQLPPAAPASGKDSPAPEKDKAKKEKEKD